MVQLALFAALEEVFDNSVPLIFGQIRSWHLVASTSKNWHLLNKMGRTSTGGSRAGAPFATWWGVEIEGVSFDFS